MPWRCLVRRGCSACLRGDRRSECACVKANSAPALAAVPNASSGVGHGTLSATDLSLLSRNRPLVAARDQAVGSLWLSSFAARSASLAASAASRIATAARSAASCSRRRLFSSVLTGMRSRKPGVQVADSRFVRDSPENYAGVRLKPGLVPPTARPTGTPSRWSPARVYGSTLSTTPVVRHNPRIDLLDHYRGAQNS